MNQEIGQFTTVLGKEALKEPQLHSFSLVTAKLLWEYKLVSPGYCVAGELWMGLVR